MSSTNTATQIAVQCHAPDCEESGNKWRFWSGKYCSERCETIASGRHALQEVLDHTVCGTCFHSLKEVEKPKPHWEFCVRGHAWTIDEDGDPDYKFFDQTESRAAAVGFQYLTEHADVGEKQRGARVVTGTVCGECGGGSYDHHEILTTHDDIARLVDKHLRPSDDVHVDAATLHRVYASTEHLDLAVGQALEDDE